MSGARLLVATLLWSLAHSMHSTPTPPGCCHLASPRLPPTTTPQLPSVPAGPCAAQARLALARVPRQEAEPGGRPGELSWRDECVWGGGLRSRPVRSLMLMTCGGNGIAPSHRHATPPPQPPCFPPSPGGALLLGYHTLLILQLLYLLRRLQGRHSHPGGPQSRGGWQAAGGAAKVPPGAAAGAASSWAATRGAPRWPALVPTWPNGWHFSAPAELAQQRCVAPEPAGCQQGLLEAHCGPPPAPQQR